MTKGKYGILDTSYLSKRHKQYILKENKKKDDLIEITWANLKTLRDTNSLQQGKWYKIVDYVATTTQEETRSANHPFDIIVRADSSSVLNENAFAAQHKGDEYFELAHFEGWKLKYCLDNDRTRFAWADQENGKGIIYWMQDEWANEAYYDFKGIQFRRSADWFSGHERWAEGIFDGEVPDEDKYFYFLSVLVDGEVKDASVIGNSLENDEGKISGVYGNKDSLVSEYDIYTDENAIYALSKNCFVGIIADGCYFGCYSNTFGNDCCFNTFGDSCNTNIFGHGCSNNIFGNSCYDNIFGNYCCVNTLGEDCAYNTFGNVCSAITFDSNRVQSVIIYSKTYNIQVHVVDNVSYPQFVGKDINGTVRVWTIDDILAAKDVILRLNTSDFPYSTKIEISKDLYDKAAIASLLMWNNVRTLPSSGKLCGSVRDNNDKSLSDVFDSYITGLFDEAWGIYSFGKSTTNNGVFDFLDGGEVSAFFREGDKYYFYGTEM